MKNIILLCIALSCVLLSCKKDENNSNTSSRTLTYEISGNFTGTFFAAYTTATGGTTNEQITSLPWRKEITYASNVTSAAIALVGNGGVAGQKVTLTVKRGNQLVGTPIDVTANSSGAFSETAPVVVF